MLENPKRLFYLLPALLAILLVGSEIVERSMYTDGVAYAGLSMNMANGIGSFWYPKLGEIHHFAFHEHPPLVFGLQSLVFEVFGDGLVSERIYTILIFLLSAWLMVVLWKEALIGKPRLQKLWFLPLTVWLANEVVYHFYAANILEPTMTLFTLGAVYLCMRSLRPGTTAGRHYGLIVAGGLLVFAATLCKGLVALFPLAFFGIHWLVYRRQSLGAAVLSSLALVATVGVAYAVLLQFEAPRDALWKYFDSQVMASLLSERSYENHFRGDRMYIVRKGLAILLPSFAISGLLFYFGRRKGAGWSVESTATKAAFLFLTLGVAAFLPLAVSPKQSFYYLLPSMAYFALGFATFIAPAAAHLYALRLSDIWKKALIGAVAILTIAAVANTISHWGKVNNRDRMVINDIDQMNTVLQPYTTIGAVGNVRDMVSYFARMSNISLDTTVSKATDYEYFIAPIDEDDVAGTRVDLRTEKYGLWKKEE